MSADQVPSGQPNDAASGDQGEKKDVVDYSTYSKVLGEAKSAKLKANELQSKIEEMQEKLKHFETEKMQLEGNKDEAIERLRNELAEALKEKKSVKTNYAFSTVKKQVEAKAKALGCYKPEFLINNIDLGKIKVDSETFDVDEETLDILLEDFKKENPFLFKSGNVKINDVNPKAAGSSQKISLRDMTPQQLEELYRKL